MARRKRTSVYKEFIAFFKHNKAYWLAPLVIAVLLFATILVFGGGAAAPFIYTLF